MRLYYIFFINISFICNATFFIDLERFNLIENIANKYIAENQTPGVVVVIGDNKNILYSRAFGNRSIYPTKHPMTLNTLFDIASLTKVVATSTAIIILAERGLLYLNEPVCTYIPEFAKNGKNTITIEQLLLHTSGLPFVNPLSDYQEGYENIFKNAFSAGLINKPGQKFLYSDLGYIILGELIKRVSGKNLDQFVKENIFDKLMMKNTQYILNEEQKKLVAPTQKRNDTWIQGEARDLRAYLLKGIAGHTGIFSDANDLSIFCRMILNKGTYNKVRVLSNLGIKRMAMIHNVSDNKQRGLGWDIQTEYSCNKGDFFIDAIGHTGYSGTSMLIDFNSNIFIIILTNRIHYGPKANITGLRSAIANIVSSALYEKN